jgi:hypothetical protein
VIRSALGASYHTRKSFRRHLLEKEFADDYSLNPKNSHHNISATSNVLTESSNRMTSTIQLKHEQSLEKHFNFEKSRQQTALLDPELLLQNAIQKSLNDKMETDYEELMKRYQRGDHIFQHHITEEHNNIDLETILYTNAAQILSNSSILTSSHSHSHPLGHHDHPPPKTSKKIKPKTKTKKKNNNDGDDDDDGDGDDYEKEMKNKQKYLVQMRHRLDLYSEYLSMKATCRQLEEIITEIESKIEIITLEVESQKIDDNFDWLLDRHNLIRKYKAELLVHHEDLTHSHECVEMLSKKICLQYPEMREMLSLGILDRQEQKNYLLQQLSHTATATGRGRGIATGPGATGPAGATGAGGATEPGGATGAGGAGAGAEVSQQDFNLTGTGEKKIRMINASGEEISLIYGWIVGKLNPDGRITHLLFGQFTESDEPPSKGWIPLAKVIPIDSQNFLTVPNTQEIGSKSQPLPTPPLDLLLTLLLLTLLLPPPLPLPMRSLISRSEWYF